MLVENKKEYGDHSLCIIDKVHYFSYIFILIKSHKLQSGSKCNYKVAQLENYKVAHLENYKVVQNNYKVAQKLQSGA